MTSEIKHLLALALLASLSGPVLAADLGQIIPAPAEEEYVPVEVGSGWYIRGDLSYDLATSTSGSYRTYGPVGAPVYSTNAYDNFDLAETADISIGAGYQFNSWLRADATLGYWGRDVDGTDTAPTACLPGFALAVGCRSEDSTQVHVWELMANAYADLGTFAGVTPYLGAGAGFAKVDYDNLSNTAFCTDATGADVAGCGYTDTHEGLDSWRFSWALMAGASYDLTQNTKLDLGYRYSQISGGDMFGWDSGTAAIGATGIQGSDDGFSQHQIKAGIRYSLW
jgi:opacity protein-like surface antigen